MLNIIFKLIIYIFFIAITFERIEAKNLLNKDEDGLFNDRLENVNLSEIRFFFEVNYGIKFSGEDFLYDTNISGSFEKLSAEQVLRRVLSRKNYAFTFNIRGELMEVTLLPGIRDTKQIKNNKIINNFKSENDQLPEHFKIKNLTSDNMKKFQTINIEMKETTIKDINNDPNFQIEINSPPSEKKSNIKK